MSRSRWIAALLTLAALAGLFHWQLSRERQIAACRDGGGSWDGARGVCKPSRAPILGRDNLRRT